MNRIRIAVAFASLFFAMMAIVSTLVTVSIRTQADTMITIAAITCIVIVTVAGLYTLYKLLEER